MQAPIQPATETVITTRQQIEANIQHIRNQQSTFILQKQQAEAMVRQLDANLIGAESAIAAYQQVLLLLPPDAEQEQEAEVLPMALVPREPALAVEKRPFAVGDPVQIRMDVNFSEGLSGTHWLRQFRQERTVGKIHEVFTDGRVGVEFSNLPFFFMNENELERQVITGREDVDFGDDE